MRTRDTVTVTDRRAGPLFASQALIRLGGRARWPGARPLAGRGPAARGDAARRPAGCEDARHARRWPGAARRAVQRGCRRRRRSAQAAHVRGTQQLRHVAFKFAILEASTLVRRYAWSHRDIELPENVEVADRQPQPDLHAEAGDLARAVSTCIDQDLHPHQRRIAIALLVDGSSSEQPARRPPADHPRRAQDPARRTAADPPPADRARLPSAHARNLMTIQLDDSGPLAASSSIRLPGCSSTTASRQWTPMRRPSCEARPTTTAAATTQRCRHMCAAARLARGAGLPRRPAAAALTDPTHQPNTAARRRTS